MVTAREIREKLASYLSNGIDLDMLEDWIVANTWNIHLQDDLDAQHLAYSTELRLSEYSTGHLAEAALRQELSVLLSSVMVEVDHMLIGDSHGSNLAAAVPDWAGRLWTPADTVSEGVSS